MINKIKANVFQFCFEKFGSCAYLVLINDKKILIDTSSSENKEELISDLKKAGCNPEDINFVLLTHTHWDHIGNLSLFVNADIFDAKNIKGLNIKEIEVIKTPGHTKDSLCFLYEDVLFSGDTIFHNHGRGRTDLPGGSEPEILESIKKLKKLDYKILCPGHI